MAQIIPVWLSVKNEFSTSGIFNPFLSVQLAWDLGNGWGFSYMLGYYTAVQGTISTSSNSVNQRFALSYTANGWNLTTNNILGIVDRPLTNYPHGSPCPTFPSKGCNTDFYNNDMTATRKFGKWEFGGVGYFSTDLNTPIQGYRKQSQFAVGFLVGYHFGRAVLQTYLTRDVYQKNYGGYDTRLWTSIDFKSLVASKFGIPRRYSEASVPDAGSAPSIVAASTLRAFVTPPSRRRATPARVRTRAYWRSRASRRDGAPARR